MNSQWNSLSSIVQVDDIKLKISNEKSVVIFKHSTTCSISAIAKSRLEDLEINDSFDFYYLDLLSYREVSNYVADAFEVVHESPQILVIKDQECTYENSHLGIDIANLASQI